MDQDKTTGCEKTDSNSTKTFVWLLFGVTVGAAAAVLMAPRSGRETREKLNGWWRSARTKFRFDREPQNADARAEKHEELVEA